jgi:DNA-binding MarR family transcriptional regulator
MNVNEIFLKIIESAVKILEGTGVLEVVSSGKLLEEDLIIKVRTKDKIEYSLYFEIKSIGQPRYTRMAVNQLKDKIADKPKSYGIFGAPYLSEESVRICKENGIGFVDLAGNCFIRIGEIYIDIQGKPNPYPNTRPLKSLFTQKATRAIRVLLCRPKREWFVKALAEEANISIGQASNIKQKLLDHEFIKLGKNRSFQLAAPGKLLQNWAENYTFRKNKITGYYSLDEVKEIEYKLARFCGDKNIQYAFTLTSGASLVSPSVRYNKVFAYVPGSMEDIARELGWKEVSLGPNISLLAPYDEGVLYGLQEVNGSRVVSDVQLYLDLKSYKERGAEAAEFLLENRIRKQW